MKHIPYSLRNALAAVLVLTLLLCCVGCGAEGEAEAEAPVQEAEAAQEVQEAAAELLKQAQGLLAEDNYQEAVPAFTAVLELDPENGEACGGRALALTGLAAAEADVSTYVEYVTTASQDLLAAEGLGKAPGEAGDRERIIDFLDAHQALLRERRDTDSVLAFEKLLTVLAESKDEEVCWHALQKLNQMLVGYDWGDLGIPDSYVETIDRPVYEFLLLHKELWQYETGVWGAYHASCALGEFETAAEAYAYLLENFDPNDSQTEYRADGITDIENESECDIFGRTLISHIHDGGRGDYYTEWEYDGSSLKPVSNHGTNRNGSFSGTYHYYEDGRLASLEITGRSSTVISYTYTENEVTETQEPSDSDPIVRSIPYSGSIGIIIWASNW